MKVRVVQNKRQLNDDKTEILLTGSTPGIDLPSSVCVGHSDIPFSSAARNLGAICIKGTGEQTLSNCILGDQADPFSPTLSFF